MISAATRTNAIVGLLIVSLAALGAPVHASEPPLPPMAAAAYFQEDGSILVEWAEPLDDGDAPLLGYNIYRSTNGDVPEPIGNASTSYFIDDDSVGIIIPGTIFTYFVTAVNEFGESIESNPATPIPGTKCTVVKWYISRIVSEPQNAVEVRPQCLPIDD